MLYIDNTFLVTYFAHPELLDLCLSSIRKIYPDNKIIVSQQKGDFPVDEIIRKYNARLIFHDMFEGNWADACRGLIEHCETNLATLIEHDCVLLKSLGPYLGRIHSGQVDMIGPEEVIPNLRNTPGMICQNFFMVNAKKIKEIGVDKIQISWPQVEELKARNVQSIESGYGVSFMFDKKEFLPVTPSGYAHGTYYGDIVHHIWYGSFRKRNVEGDGVDRWWMESEVTRFIEDYNKGLIK